jgi:hypothetical protein
VSGSSSEDFAKRKGMTYALEDVVRRSGNAMALLDRLAGGLEVHDVEVSGLKIRLGVTDQIETLVVVTAVGEDGTPLVGFNGSMVPSDALVGAINRVVNGQMKWRLDEYRSARPNPESE